MNVPRVPVGGENEVDVAPLIGEVVVPLVPLYHWYVFVPVPLAVTLIGVGELFLWTVCDVGEKAVIVGAGLTVTAVAALVALQLFALRTVTV